MAQTLGASVLHRRGDVGFFYSIFDLVVLDETRGDYAIREEQMDPLGGWRTQIVRIPPGDADWLLTEGAHSGLGYRRAFDLFWGLTRDYEAAASVQ